MAIKHFPNVPPNLSREAHLHEHVYLDNGGHSHITFQTYYIISLIEILYIKIILHFFREVVYKL